MKFKLEDIKKYKNLELLAKQFVEGFITGLHKSPYHGFSVEFSEHKQYNTGESTKNIDWKVYARTDKLFIKQYEEETNLRAYFLIDSSSSMYYPEENNGKIAFSVFACAALQTILQSQRDAIGLINFNEKIEYQSPVKSTSMHLHQQMVYLSALLDKKSNKVETSTAETIHALAQKIGKRGLVVLFTDMFDRNSNIEEIFTAIQHLKHKKHEILIFHVLDKPTEIDFEFENRPYLFIDKETGEQLKINPSEVKNSYQKNIQSLIKQVELKCHQLKIDYIPVDINTDFDKVLSSYFVKRKRMQK